MFSQYYLKVLFANFESTNCCCLPTKMMGVLYLGTFMWDFEEWLATFIVSSTAAE